MAFANITQPCRFKVLHVIDIGNLLGINACPHWNDRPQALKYRSQALEHSNQRNRSTTPRAPTLTEVV